MSGTSQVPAAQRGERNEPLKLNMTPMIDVVFQLIVFFLVSMKFRTLDMKIDATLPPEGLRADVPQPPPPPKLVAMLQRRPGEPATRVRIANETIGEISDAPDRAVATEATLARLARTASAARARAGDAGAFVRGEIDAAPRVPSGHVIRCVDALLAGNITDVSFVGTPPPDRRDRLPPR